MGCLTFLALSKGGTAQDSVIAEWLIGQRKKPPAGAGSVHGLAYAAGHAFFGIELLEDQDCIDAGLFEDVERGGRV
jgi:hypothetical protein